MSYDFAGLPPSLRISRDSILNAGDHGLNRKQNHLLLKPSILQEGLKLELDEGIGLAKHAVAVAVVSPAVSVTV